MDENDKKGNVLKIKRRESIMFLFFVSVEKQRLSDFENGVTDAREITQAFAKADRIRLQEIDRVVNVLARGDVFSKYWDIFENGNLLTGGNSESLIIDPVSFLGEDGGGFETYDPVVYVLNDDVRKIAAVLSEINEKQFKEAFDAKMKKLTKYSFLSKKKKALKEKAPEIYEHFWNEFEILRNFYQKVNETDHLIVIFSMYEEEDFG